MKKISAIILTYNNQELISGCLRSLTWTDEIIIVDTGSSDKTINIARRYHASIISSAWQGFSAARNLGAEKAKGDWLLYIDSDERVSKNLRKELISLLKNDHTPHDSYQIPRRNYLLGKIMRHGGWYPEPQHRLLKKEAFYRWQGELHEHPQVRGKSGTLKGEILHLSHRGIKQMLEKTIHYTRLEAELRLKSNHPRVKIIHLFSAPAREFLRRGIMQSGWRDGIEGFIEIIYQAFNQFLIMVWLWEMQSTKTMKKKYQNLDKQISKET